MFIKMTNLLCKQQIILCSPQWWIHGDLWLLEHWSYERSSPLHPSCYWSFLLLDNKNVKMCSTWQCVKLDYLSTWQVPRSTTEHSPNKPQVGVSPLSGTSGIGEGRPMTSLRRTGWWGNHGHVYVFGQGHAACDDDKNDADDDDGVKVPGARPEDDSSWVAQGVRAQQHQPGGQQWFQPQRQGFVCLFDPDILESEIWQDCCEDDNVVSQGMDTTSSLDHLEGREQGSSSTRHFSWDIAPNFFLSFFPDRIEAFCARPLTDAAKYQEREKRQRALVLTDSTQLIKDKIDEKMSFIFYLALWDSTELIEDKIERKCLLSFISDRQNTVDSVFHDD